ncbi:MAG: 6-bladed beta-propeller, partial [Muribaculaceae bacterium]|nr:6-bladed beta-propeller [Muribaculaceae bacterium]
MKQIVIFALIVVLVLPFFGCKHNASMTGYQECDTLVSAGVKNLNSIADISSLRQVLITETNDNSLIGRSLKRVIEHDSLLIFVDNMKQVLVFTRDGRHKFTINNVGQGPGEYTNLADAAIDSNGRELLLLTYTHLLRYSLSDGKYLGVAATFETYPYEVVVEDDKAYLLKSTYLNNELEQNAVAVLDLSTGKITEYMKPNEDFAPSQSYNGPALTTIGSDCVVLTRKFDPYIYSLNANSYSAAYKIDWGDDFLMPEPGTVYSSEELFQLSMKTHKVFVVNDVQKGDLIMTFSTNVPRFYYANLNTKEVFSTQLVKDSELPLSTLTLLPITNSDGWVIASFDNMMVEMMAKRNPDNAELQNLAAKLNEDSNPLMIMYKLK